MTRHEYYKMKSDCKHQRGEFTYYAPQSIFHGTLNNAYVRLDTARYANYFLIKTLATKCQSILKNNYTKTTTSIKV